MPTSALVLALGAAFLHAFWNLILARARDIEAATAVALVAGAVAFAPLTVLLWDAEREVVPFIVVTSFLQLLYFLLLAAAYGRAELSFVYPIARGSAPVLVLLVGVVVLGDSASTAEVGGVLLVAAGVLLVRGVGGHARASDLALALAVAATIAAYTLVDKRGIEYASPIVYLELRSSCPRPPSSSSPLHEAAGRRCGARSVCLRSPPVFSRSAPTPSCSPLSSALLRRRLPPFARRASSSRPCSRRRSSASASGPPASRAPSSSSLGLRCSPRAR